MGHGGRAQPPPLSAPTLGAEEELQVVDAGTGRLVSRADEVLDRLGDRTVAGAGSVVPELTRSQVETVTGVSSGVEDLLGRALALRSAVARAAATQGLAVLASATPVLGDAAEQVVASGDRYVELQERAPFLVREQLIAGLHVHLGLAGLAGDASGTDDHGSAPDEHSRPDERSRPDDDERAAVVDGLRPWLPVLLAITANSPYWLGHDTGFASYRYVHWQRWPVVGPPPRVGDAAGWSRRVAEMVGTGVVPDASYVYWDARLSSRFPTVEVRVADVMATLDDTVAYVSLVRGLAVRAVLDHRAGRPQPDVPQHVLRAAMWRAARHGLDDALVHPLEGGLVPARDAVAAMAEHARPGLELTGDGALLHDGLGRLATDGNGARRQRRAFERRGWDGVVDLLRVDPDAGPARATRGDGNGWVECDCGHRHWGRHGAAGLLAVRPGAHGRPEALLQLRASWTHQGGTWGLPGGARDSHESVAEAARREAFEETCLDPQGLVVVGEHVDDHGTWSYTYVLVRAPRDAHATVANPESDAVEWVPVDEVGRRRLHPALQQAWPGLLQLLARVAVD
jgi:carboxylate-amine ligase